MREYGFTENKDFIPHSQKCESGEIEVCLKTVISQKGIEFIDTLLSDLGYIKKINYDD